MPSIIHIIICYYYCYCAAHMSSSSSSSSAVASATALRICHHHHQHHLLLHKKAAVVSRTLTAHGRPQRPRCTRAHPYPHPSNATEKRLACMVILDNLWHHLNC